MDVPTWGERLVSRCPLKQDCEPTEHSRVLRWGRVLSQTLSLHLWPREVQYPWNNSQPRRARCWRRGDPAFSSPLFQGAPKVTSQTTRIPVLVPESALVGIQTMGHVNGWISSSRKVYPHSDRSPQMHRLCISFSGGQRVQEVGLHGSTSYVS